MQIVEVHFPPGGHVVFETSVRDTHVHQQIWVLEGTIDIMMGKEHHPAMFHNLTQKNTRYAVVIAYITT